MSRGFANPLTELAEFEQLQESLKKKKGPVQVSGCLDSQKVHLMYWLGISPALFVYLSAEFRCLSEKTDARAHGG